MVHSWSSESTMQSKLGRLALAMPCEPGVDLSDFLFGLDRIRFDVDFSRRLCQFKSPPLVTVRRHNRPRQGELRRGNIKGYRLLRLANRECSLEYLDGLIR
jgi:hypothetical protein